MSKTKFIVTRVKIVQERNPLNLEDHPIALPKHIEFNEEDIFKMVIAVGIEHVLLGESVAFVYNYSQSEDRKELKILAKVSGIKYEFREAENETKTLRIIATVKDNQTVPVAFGYNDSDSFYIVNGDRKPRSEAATIKKLQAKKTVKR